jgi:hypothetical protein
MKTNKFVKLFSSIQSGIFGLFLITLALVILHDFVLSEILREYSFDNYIVKVDNLIYFLSLSYIASFIFYFLVVHLKNLQNKFNIYEYIENKNKNIIQEVERFLGDFKKTTKINYISKFPTKEELDKFFNNINLISPSPEIIFDEISGHFISWFDYFKDHKKSINKVLEKIYHYIIYLESDYVKLLLHIEDCNFFNDLDRISGFIVFDNNLKKDINLTKNLVKYIKPGALSKSLFEYFSLIKELELYAKREFYKILK